jgi:hypothetical protein
MITHDDDDDNSSETLSYVVLSTSCGQLFRDHNQHYSVNVGLGVFWPNFAHYFRCFLHDVNINAAVSSNFGSDSCHIDDIAVNGSKYFER